jgi:hypothetical protein
MASSSSSVAVAAQRSLSIYVHLDPWFGREIAWGQRAAVGHVYVSEGTEHGLLPV